MSACQSCGHDPSAVVLRTWSFFVAREVQGLNAHRGNYGGQRWAYAKDRDAWQQWFIVLGRQHCVTPASGKRRVTLTRCYGGRQREYDRDNLIGGAKSVVDSMVRARLLAGDTPEHVEVLYHQRKVTTEPGLEVRIEELASEPTLQLAVRPAGSAQVARERSSEAVRSGKRGKQ